MRVLKRPNAGCSGLGPLGMSSELNNLVAELRALPAAAGDLLRAVTLGARAARVASAALLTGAEALSTGADQLHAAVQPAQQAGQHVAEATSDLSGLL